MNRRCTFAVVGHNEAERLHVALSLAHDAARPDDRVWYVDSASDDGSAGKARALGADVIDAPIGKGAAMAAAIDRCDDGYLCFLDADTEHAASNFAARLRGDIETAGVDMVVGAFDEPGRRLTLTPTLYRPMVGALFPESLELGIKVPLCGFRVLRADLDWGRIPPGYGVETHLNLVAGLEGRATRNCELGLFRGPLRGYRNVVPAGADLVAAILDLAVERQRIRPEARAGWERWANEVLEYIEGQPPEGADDAAFMDGIADLAARPLPTRGH